MPLDAETKRHPWVTRKLGNLGDTPKVDVSRKPANEAYLAILREVSKVLSMRDITEEFVVCRCFPVKEGWSVPSWAPPEKEVYGLPMPNFSEAFGLQKEREFEFFFFFLKT